MIDQIHFYQVESAQEQLDFRSTSVSLANVLSTAGREDCQPVSAVASNASAAPRGKSLECKKQNMQHCMA